MRNKLHNAKNYVADHKGMFMVGGVVVFVYATVMVTAVLNLKNAELQYEIVKLNTK